MKLFLFPTEDGQLVECRPVILDNPPPPWPPIEEILKEARFKEDVFLGRVLIVLLFALIGVLATIYVFLKVLFWVLTIVIF